MQAIANGEHLNGEHLQFGTGLSVKDMEDSGALVGKMQKQLHRLVGIG